MPRTTLYLVRHGEQDTASPDDDSGLSARGREQAAALAERLGGSAFDAFHHSPLTRAAQTAQILAERLTVTRHACDLVLDRTPTPGSGSWYPERFDQFFADVPAEERDPGAARIRAAVEALGAIGEHDRTDLIVTHNFVIGWFVRHVLDAPEWRWLGLNQANCGLTVVAFDTGRPPALIGFNDVGHL